MSKMTELAKGSTRFRGTNIMSEKIVYTVWVGGTEISNCYMTKEDAESTAEMFIENGYTDVVIEEINNEDSI